MKTTRFLAALAYIAAVPLWIFSSQANAALLGLSVGYPDVSIGGALVNYSAPICNKSSGGGAPTGICNATNYNGTLVTPGTMTITDANNGTGGVGAMFYTGDGNVNAFFTGDFSLTAYLDKTGTFGTSVTANSTTYNSNLSLIMKNSSLPNVGTAPPDFTIITALLGAFGFSGTGSAGALDFAAGSAYGGDVTGGYWNTVKGSEFSGTIVGLTINGGTIPVGTWTTSNLLLTNWSSNSGTTVNTFIPVPAAAWLFGSGLIALLGFAKRRRAAGFKGK